ncbi:MAG TPA: branched-chain amino acid ABC transporter permease, partial [Terrimesophilobacter sp.]|nr:branched-chain amino acid ABC transporter permease [Terrimesophilobacter sp.]
LAGAAGVMAGAYYGKIDFLMGFIIGLKAFTAAVIGGIGNIKGAMLGGLVLGLVEAFGSDLFGGQWRDVFAFGVLILFLTLRPTGILGERVTERV